VPSLGRGAVGRNLTPGAFRGGTLGFQRQRGERKSVTRTSNESGALRLRSLVDDSVCQSCQHI
jgi:hypothetical protein